MCAQGIKLPSTKYNLSSAIEARGMDYGRYVFNVNIRNLNLVKKASRCFTGASCSVAAENETAPAGSAAANIVQLVDNFIYERVSLAIIHHTKDSVQFAEAFLARRDIGRT